MTAQVWAAPERNKGPILQVLARLVPTPATVLEVAAGSGQHAAHFVAHGPGWDWIATDPDPENLASVAAWRSTLDPAATRGSRMHVRPFSVFDAWSFGAIDAVYCANMIHIAPWSAAEALVRGAASVLHDGPLVLYGPFVRAGVETAPSNVAFDQSLRARDPAFGLRSLESVSELAASHGLALREIVEMPANNLVVVWGR